MGKLKHIQELRSWTYQSAAGKLKNLGHTDRSNALKEWGDKIEAIEDQESGEKFRNIFKRFGTFNIAIAGDICQQGYLIIEMDTDNSIESQENDESEYYFFAHVYFIPIDESSYDEMMNDNDINCMIHRGLLPLWDCMFNIKNRDTKGVIDNLEINKHSDWEGGESGYWDSPIEFCDRRSAYLFRKLLIDIFTDRILYPHFWHYPNYDVDIGEDAYNIMQRDVFNQSGWTEDLGLSPESFSDFLKTYSINKLYKD